MNKTIQLSLISVALLSSLYADNQYTLQNIEVTASQGTTLNKKDVTDSVTIITKEAIEESRVTNLAEALNKLGNISMTQNGGMGKTTSMYIRGMKTSRILVLIDGVRYNNPTSFSGAEFSQIMLYNVEQIEIIKGSQSGVWGADATSGVINIVTSNAKEGAHGLYNLEFGSFGTVKTSLQASYATEKFNILLSGLSHKTAGFSAVEPNRANPDYFKRYDELGLERDAYENKSINLKLGYNFTSKTKIQANIQAIDSEVEFDSSLYDYTTGISTPVDDPLPKTDLKNRFYNIALTHTNDIHHIKLQYNLSTFDRELVDSYGTSEYKGLVNEIKLDDKITYIKDSFLRVGLSQQIFKQKEITANTDKEYKATSAFVTNYNKVQLLSNLNTIVTQSLRYDKYDNFDNSLTGKIGVKQFIDNSYYVSLNAGTGFNAPTLGQLYGKWGANPDLKPEKSQTIDITVGNDTLWLTGFYNEIEDLIEYDWSSGYIQSEGKSTFKGVEVGYEDYFFDSLGINAMYTYLRTEDSEGKSLARRPKHQIDTNVVYYVSDTFDIGLNTQYIGTRYDKADREGVQTGKYIVSNFTTNVEINNHVTIYGKIDNITDKYYQTVDGYATAGRSFYVGLNAKY